MEQLQTENNAAGGLSDLTDVLGVSFEKSALVIRRDRHSTDEMTNGAIRIALLGRGFCG